MARGKSYGTTWWGKKWLESLSDIDYANRIPRGRTYANKGMVYDVNIYENEGKITAKVEGNYSPYYNVTLRFKPVQSEQKKAFMDDIIQDFSIISKLTNRELDPKLMSLALKHNIKLLPRSWTDLQMKCNCPDCAVPCKHIAAVIYVVSEIIDSNPFIIFSLKGINLLDEIQKSRISLDEATQVETVSLGELYSNSLISFEQAFAQAYIHDVPLEATVVERIVSKQDIALAVNGDLNHEGNESDKVNSDKANSNQANGNKGDVEAEDDYDVYADDDFSEFDLSSDDFDSYDDYDDFNSYDDFDVYDFNEDDIYKQSKANKASNANKSSHANKPSQAKKENDLEVSYPFTDPNLIADAWALGKDYLLSHKELFADELKDDPKLQYKLDPKVKDTALFGKSDTLTTTTAYATDVTVSENEFVDNANQDGSKSTGQSKSGSKSVTSSLYTMHDSKNSSGVYDSEASSAETVVGDDVANQSTSRGKSNTPTNTPTNAPDNALPNTPTDAAAYAQAQTKVSTQEQSRGRQQQKGYGAVCLAQAIGRLEMADYEFANRKKRPGRKSKSEQAMLQRAALGQAKFNSVNLQLAFDAIYDKTGVRVFADDDEFVVQSIPTLQQEPKKKS